jgi:hypothetical protein
MLDKELGKEYPIERRAEYLNDKVIEEIKGYGPEIAIIEQ